jgi:hypothetical protein
MANARSISSRPLRYMGLAASLATLAGCVATEGLLAQGLRLNSFASSADEEQVLAIEPVEEKAIVRPDVKAQIIPVASRPEQSAWCEYLQEDTAAQTTVLRSPSLRGSVSDDGKAGLSISMSAVDLYKANVMEETAEANCRRYLAESGLQKLIFLTPQGLTASGFKAIHKSISGQTKEIARLRNKAKRAMEQGMITREQATAVAVLADQIHAESNAAKSQSDRRINDRLMPEDTAEYFGAALMQAESDLQDLNSRMRTLDAMDISASAGWNDDLNDNGFDTTSEAFTAKVNMSVRLGALLPQRFDHEHAAKAARLRAINEEGGVVWKVNALRRAHERAIEGLQAQERDLAQAIAKAEKLAKMLASVPNPEFEGSLIHAKMQLIKLRANKAGVIGSIAEIRSNLKKLNAG